MTEGPTAIATPVASTPVPSTPGEEASQRLWYEVDRSGDLEGNLVTTLLIGTLDGTVSGRIVLGEQRPSERDDPKDTFELADPQATGIFGGRVLAWGRDEGGRQIEFVDIESGRIQNVVQAAGAVHSATANEDGSRVFYVTADAITDTATGLWQYDLGNQSPARLEVDLGTEPIASDNRYRLAASANGRWLAIQTPESIILMDTTTGSTDSLAAPGPVVGFAGDTLVAYGARQPEGGRLLVAFDVETLDGEVIANRVDAAQLASISGADIVAYMVIDPSWGQGYGVWVSDLENRSPVLTYQHSHPEPLMPLQDRAFVGENAPDWVLLGTSFIPAIEGEGNAPLPEESFPILLNVLNGHTERLGPFRADEG